MLDLTSLETSSLIAVMNKLPAKSYICLNKTCKALRNFADRYQGLIGVLVESRIDCYHRGRLEVSVDGNLKRYSLSEAVERFCGFSFGHVSFHFDFETAGLTAEEEASLLSFLKARVWRRAYLSLYSPRPDVLDLVRPRWLFTSLPLSKLEDNSYVKWLSQITAIPQIERLVYGINNYRGMKIFELALQRWCSCDLGSLINVVPGINFTFCNVEGMDVENIIETIQRRHMKQIFATLEKILGEGGHYWIVKESYEDNHLPKERFTENIELEYKPVGVIKIHTRSDEKEGCLAVEITQYGETDFNVAFCFYTKKETVEEYEKRMKELLSPESSDPQQ